MSAANDEGITALHNAICAGHLSVAEYLVNYGCDVNAPDSDGWLVYYYFVNVYGTNLSWLDSLWLKQCLTSKLSVYC